MGALLTFSMETAEREESEMARSDVHTFSKGLFGSKTLLIFSNLILPMTSGESPFYPRFINEKAEPRGVSSPVQGHTADDAQA